MVVEGGQRGSISGVSASKPENGTLSQANILFSGFDALTSTNAYTCRGSQRARVVVPLLGPVR